jgi:CrcB protein
VRDTAVVLGVLAVGGLGAVARFAVDSLVERRSRTAFPLGTFAINVGGSFVLGVLTGASVASTTLLVVGTGLLGSFTTFSRWMFAPGRRAADAEGALALDPRGARRGAGLALAVAGYALGAAL